MPENAGSLEILAGELATLFQPLEARFGADGAAGLLRSLGLRPPPDLLEAALLVDALASGASAATDLTDLIADLARAIADDDAGRIATAAPPLLGKLRDVVAGISGVASALDGLSASLPGLSAAERAELDAFADAFPKRLLDLLFVEYLENRFQQLALALLVAGVIEEVEEDGGGAALQAAHLRKSFHFDRLTKLLSDPAGLLREVYGWGAPGFDGLVLFRTLRRLLDKQLAMPAEILTPPGLPAILEAFGFRLEVDPATSPPSLGLSLRFPADVTLAETVPQDDWEIRLASQVRFAADIEGTVAPLLAVELRPPSGTAAVSLSLSVGRSETAAPALLLGEAGGSRLEASRLAASVGLEAFWESATGGVELQPEIAARLAGRLVIDSSRGDGFLTALLSGIGIAAAFDVGLRWSPAAGIRFEGSSALEIQVPVNLSLGPISLPTIYLAVGLRDGQIPVELSASLAAKLGPLDAAVDSMGLLAELSFPDRGGNLGPLQLDMRFKPPTGVGLSLDSGVFTGGGFLRFDPANERYEGILQLSFQELFTVTAIGLITTRLPDGSKGFSLLILISVEFTPIQLGFGFTLNGVGGLLGLNRTLVVDALRQGIKDNAVDHVMFPEDPVANAARILSDLRTFFPPAQDQFLIGPMGLLGWGVPTLITLELALIVEVPDPVRIAILGVLRIALPDDKAPLLSLQVNFFGVIDFEAKYLAFDASLYDSRLLTMTLSGGMAVRLGWGDDPAFLITVGGFHPSYDPPHANLPAVERLTLSLLPSANPRLTLQCYFAVTSNTVQFGARVELYAGVSKFNVYGWLGFDVLFQFSPFLFIAEVSAGLAVRIGSTPILSVTLTLTLKGPTPYNAVGTAKFRILFISFKVRFNKTWGEERDTRLPPAEVLPLLAAALADNRNWETVVPSRASQVVRLRELPAAGERVFVHPHGKLTVRQKVVPLEIKVQKLGANAIADGDRFAIERVETEGVELATTTVRDEFAPAQFFDLADSEKLSRDSFEELPSGVTIGASDRISAGPSVTRVVEYEPIVIDARPLRLLFTVVMKVLRFRTFLRGGVLATSKPALEARPAGSSLSPGRVRVAAESYTVVNVSDLQPAAAAVRGLTRTEAVQRLEALVAEDPARARTLQVVCDYEVAA